MALIDRVRRDNDATATMAIVYVVWFFLGTIGVHRMISGRVGSGVTMLVLNGLGWLTFLIGIGFVIWAALGIWWIIDAFLIPGWVRR